MNINKLSNAGLFLITFGLLVVAGLQWYQAVRLGDITDELLNTSNAQTNLAEELNSISESQKEIMQQNLELIKPKINCWWNVVGSRNSTKIEIMVVNSGQTPELIDRITVRPKKVITANLNIAGGESSVIVEGNKTTCLTPATIILGGEKKYIECDTPQLAISSAKVKNVPCNIFNQSIILEETGLSD